jgi:hypothetical protein
MKNSICRSCQFCGLPKSWHIFGHPNLPYYHLYVDQHESVSRADDQILKLLGEAMLIGMWKCACGWFNPNETAYCMRCNMSPRIGV